MIEFFAKFILEFIQQRYLSRWVFDLLKPPPPMVTHPRTREIPAGMLPRNPHARHLTIELLQPRDVPTQAGNLCGSTRCVDGHAVQRSSNLSKQPWPSLSSPTDHDTIRTRVSKHCVCLLRSVDVAIGKNRDR